MVAHELGWYPNRAAPSRSAARAHSCGLVIARPSRILALEPFFMEFIAGVEAELPARSVALTIQLVHAPEAEIEVYRRWWAERRVDGVMLIDVRVEDPRVAEIERLGLPAVVAGGPLDGDVPSVWHDEAEPVGEVVRYLAALGHERVARVAGVGDFVHNVQRNRAFREAAAERALSAEILETDHTPESGARATRSCSRGPSARQRSSTTRPTVRLWRSASWTRSRARRPETFRRPAAS